MRMTSAGSGARRTSSVMVVPTDTLKFTFDTVLTLVLLKACVTSVRCSVPRLATAFVEVPEVVFDDAEVDDVLFCCEAPLCCVVDCCEVLFCWAAEPDGCVPVVEPDCVLCCCEEPVVERCWLSVAGEVEPEPVFWLSCEPVADCDEPCCGRFWLSDACAGFCEPVAAPASARSEERRVGKE